MGYKLKRSSSAGDESVTLRGPSSRAKKAKVVFDPSVNNAPKKRNDNKVERRGRPEGSKKSKEQVIVAPPKIPKLTTLNTSPSRPRISVKNPFITDLCMICMKQIKMPDKFIQCRSCKYKSHRKCMEDTNKHGLISLLQKNWECTNCLTCSVCSDNADMGVLYTCNNCRNSYHAICHNPRINSQAINLLKWRCKICSDINRAIKNSPIKIRNNTKVVTNFTDDNVKVNDSVEEPTEGTTVAAAMIPNIKKKQPSETSPKTSNLQVCPTPNLEKKKEATEIIKISGSKRNSVLIVEQDEDITIKIEDDAKFDDSYDVDDSIPDVKKWSCDEVFTYFHKIHPQHASVLKEQEIDGFSLLLLRRTDIIKGFSLKLGPALNMYRTILKLQTRCKDETQTWT